MRVAALYDIHGNLPALEAVLEDIKGCGIDRIVVGGDVVPGPMPLETLRRLLELEWPTQFLRGNGDRVVHAVTTGAEPVEVPEPFREGIRWNAAQLPDHLARTLGEWPSTIQCKIPRVGDVLFCHAIPRSDTEVFTRLTPEGRLAPILDGLDVALVVCGHTHMQFDRTVGSTRVVNAGSVGMPFGQPGADWLILGPDIEFRHTSYDVERAAARVQATAYPQAQEFAARNILMPPR